MNNVSCVSYDCIRTRTILVTDESFIAQSTVNNISFFNEGMNRIRIISRIHNDHYDLVFQCLEEQLVVDVFIIHCSNNNCTLTIPNFAQETPFVLPTGVLTYDDNGNICPLTLQALLLIIGSGHLDVCKAIIETPGCLEKICEAITSRSECIDLFIDNPRFREGICDIVTNDPCLSSLCLAISGDDDCIIQIGNAIIDNNIVIDNLINNPLFRDSICNIVISPSCIDNICNSLVTNEECISLLRDNIVNDNPNLPDIVCNIVTTDCIDDIVNAVFGSPLFISSVCNAVLSSSCLQEIANNSIFITSLINNTTFRENICDIITTDCLTPLCNAIASNPTCVSQIGNAIVSDPTVISTLLNNNVFIIGLGNDNNFISTLVNNNTFQTGVCTFLETNPTCITAIRNVAINNNPNFSTAVCNAVLLSSCLQQIANNATFISTLTGNSTFRDNICTIVTNDCLTALCQAIANSSSCTTQIGNAIVSNPTVINTLTNNATFRTNVCNIVSTQPCLATLCNAIAADTGTGGCVVTIGNAIVSNSTVIGTLLGNTTFTTGLGNNNNFITTLTNNSTFRGNICTIVTNDCLTALCNAISNNNNCVVQIGNAIVSNPTVINTLVNNSTFTTALGNNATFISTLTNNDAFRTNICNIVSTQPCLTTLCNAIAADSGCVTTLRSVIVDGSTPTLAGVNYDDPNPTITDIITDPGSGDFIDSFVRVAERNNATQATGIAIFQTNTNTSYTVSITGIARTPDGTSFSIIDTHGVVNINGVVFISQIQRSSRNIPSNVNLNLEVVVSGTQVLYRPTASSPVANWSIHFLIVRTT